MITTVGIVVAYILLGACLLWVVLGIKGQYLLKMALTVVTCSLAVFMWFSIEDVRGWPTDDELPAAFEVDWITVREPTPKDKGGIFITLRSMDKTEQGFTLHNINKKEPRLHRVPYSKQGHKQAQRIRKRLKLGLRVFLRGKKGGGLGGTGKGKGRGRPRGLKGPKSINENGDGSDGNPLGYRFLPFDLPEKK